MRALNDKEFEDVERLVNAAIHELVFAMHHIGDDMTEDAQDCLTTVSANVSVIQEMVAAAVRE